MGPATRPAGSVSNRRFRADIEGLRAVAVLLVVFDHLTLHPSGGFIGVDVFFVISGFLITGLLLAEHGRTNRISFRGFYERRARRILPASVVVLAVTWVSSQTIQLAGQAHQTGVDILWAAVFGANIHFAQISTDYFQHDVVHSPVQHYWSLAVEEQFYLIWPIVIVIVMGLMIRWWKPAAARPVLGAVLLSGTVASFAWSLQHTRSAPDAAYFATTDRAWELGVGAVVAICLPGLSRVPAAVRAVASPIGLAAILASAVVIDESTPFPGPGAVVPVLAAALVIAAGVAGVPRTAWALTNPVARYVGRVSFSLYLWHWPVVVLLPAVLRARGILFDMVALALTAALTIVSYHYIEEPMRHLGRRRPRHVPTRGRHRRRSPLTAARPALAAGAFLTVAIAGCTAQPPAQVSHVKPTMPVPVAQAVQPDSQRSAAVLDALKQTSWPGGLNPGLDNIQNARGGEWESCIHVDPAQAGQCTFHPAGATRHTAIVLGDSIAISWLPGLRAALVPQGYSVEGMTLLECGAADVGLEQEVKTEASWSQKCAQHKQATYQALSQVKPDLIVVSSAENTLDRLSDRRTGDAAAAEWQQGMTRALAAMHAAAPSARIAVLSPPPAGTPVSACGTQTGGPQPCVTPISPNWTRQAQAERAAAKAAGASYVDVHLLFCSVDGRCPPFIDDYLVRVDGNHLTARAAEQASAYLRRALIPS